MEKTAIKFFIYLHEISKWNLQSKTVSALASAIVCALKFLNSFARHRNLFDITKPINIDLNFLSYHVPSFLF